MDLTGKVCIITGGAPGASDTRAFDASLTTARPWS